MSERVAIVGSRNFTKLWRVSRYVTSLPRATVVISGGARGVDQTAEKTAKHLGMTTSIHKPPKEEAAASREYIRALFARNLKIVMDCDRLVAFWDGESNGTLDTIRKAVLHGKEVVINP